MALKPLQEEYKEEIAPALMKEFGYSSIMQAPGLEKIVVNVGVGEAPQLTGHSIVNCLNEKNDFFNIPKRIGRVNKNRNGIYKQKHYSPFIYKKQGVNKA